MWGYKCKTSCIIWGFECKTCLGVNWENMAGQMSRLEEKIAAALLCWLHSFPLACLILSLCFLASGPTSGIWKSKTLNHTYPMYGYSHHMKHMIKYIFLQIGILWHPRYMQWAKWSTMAKKCYWVFWQFVDHCKLT